MEYNNAIIQQLFQFDILRLLLWDRFLVTEDNLYFGRSKYVVLPGSRNGWEDENLLAYSEVQKFFNRL